MEILKINCENGATASKILSQLEEYQWLKKSGNTDENYADEEKPKKLEEIHEIIDEQKISDVAKKDAKEIFEILSVAECKIHTQKKSEIHFHEIGQSANIKKICKICQMIEEIAPDKIIATPMNLGRGEIFCSHGKLTIPAPATQEIIVGMETFTDEKKGELTTPSGAAIIKYFTKVKKWT